MAWGGLYGKREDLQKRARYYGLALEVGATLTDMNQWDRSKRLEWLVELEDFYIQNGQIGEVAKLRADYRFLWQEYEEGQVDRQ